MGGARDAAGACRLSELSRPHSARVISATRQVENP
jgi:hypothetical protein